MTPVNHLVIFARAPQRGAVKRRLAADIGAGAAYRFYRYTLHEMLVKVANDARWRTWLAVTPDSAAGGRLAGLFAGPLSGVSNVPRIPQNGGNLGVRMARPLSRPGRPGALSHGPVVIIGSDIPAIAPAHIARAFAALGDHDFVFGPAAAGGYWRRLGALACPARHNICVTRLYRRAECAG